MRPIHNIYDEYDETLTTMLLGLKREAEHSLVTLERLCLGIVNTATGIHGWYVI